MSLSRYASKAILDALLVRNADGAGDFVFGGFATPPGGAGGLWAALATAADDAADTWTEATGTGYARVQVPPTSWAPATLANPAQAVNDTVIDFGTGGTGGWSGGSDMTHLVLMDASTAGNIIVIGALDVPKPVAEGDPVTIAIGDARITMT